MHYYKKNIGDYHKKAGRLSMLEHGAYTLLIDACYDRERFPTEAEAIDWVWARGDDEIAAVRFVLSKFFELQDDGTYVQSRIAEEIAKYQANCDNNARIAREREAKRKERARTVDESTGSVDGAPPNQEPRTTNQEPEDQTPFVDGKPSPPPCPHLEIVDLYNRILPELQAVIPERWDGARAKHLQARWRESPKHQSLEFWERFFTTLRKYSWYLGDNERGWRANLGWIVEKRNFDNLIEKFVTDSRRSATA